MEPSKSPQSPQPRQVKYGAEWFIQGQARTPEEKEALIKLIDGAGHVLGILKRILINRKRSISNPKEIEYAKENWAFLTAHRNGRHEELDHMFKLLSKTEELTND